jgi:hypothetical protein
VSRASMGRYDDRSTSESGQAIFDMMSFHHFGGWLLAAVPKIAI